MYKLLVVLLVLGGCGPAEVKVKQDSPIVVTHKIDLGDLKLYFKIQCQEELVAPSPEDLDECVTGKISDFLEKVGL